MQISFCIPIFNHDSTTLIRALAQQCVSASIEYEILVFDDCSSLYKEENRQIAALPCVKYQELTQNMGRAAIRNFLAQQAQYDWLLFLDCDAILLDDEFVARYIKEIEKNEADVVIGGYRYSDEKPSDSTLYLRWLYGKRREERNIEVRNQRSHCSFSSFNFMAKKKIFNKVNFDESLRKYGHEDTLFGWLLKHNGFKISHIDNPARQVDLDSTDVYLRKLHDATENLWMIYKKVDDPVDFVKDVKVLRCFERLRKNHLLKPVYWTLKLLKPLILRNLKSNSPKIFFLDLYKLERLCFVSSEDLQTRKI